MKKNCIECRWQEGCVNPRYKKFRNKKEKHNCPAFNKITRKEIIIDKIKNLFNWK